MTDATLDRTAVTEREVTAPDGTRWIAFAHEAIVAHGRPGAVLAFRLADGTSDEVLRSTITFNSMQAADFALSTISQKDLLRRLSLARQAAAGI